MSAHTRLEDYKVVEACGRRLLGDPKAMAAIRAFLLFLEVRGARPARWLNVYGPADEPVLIHRSMIDLLPALEGHTFSAAMQVQLGVEVHAPYLWFAPLGSTRPLDWALSLVPLVRGEVVLTDTGEAYRSIAG